MSLSTKPSAILVTPISTPAKDLGSQVPDTFPAFQLPNTGIDPKLTEINRQHFCQLQCNSCQTCALERLFCFLSLPKIKQVAVASRSDGSRAELSLLQEARHLPAERSAS